MCNTVVAGGRGTAIPSFSEHLKPLPSFGGTQHTDLSSRMMRASAQSQAQSRFTELRVWHRRKEGTAKNTAASTAVPMVTHEHIPLMPSPSDGSQKVPCNQLINSPPLRPESVSDQDQMPCQ